MRVRKHTRVRSTTGMTRRRFVSTLGAAAGLAGMDWLTQRTPPAFAQGKSFPARFGTWAAVSHANAIADKFFVEEANKRSKGALKIDLFTDNQLGAPRDMLEGIQLGTIQIIEISTAFIASHIPETMAFDLPYVFTSSDRLLKFLDTPTGTETLAIERFGKLNIRGLGWYDGGGRDFFNSRRPIVTPADLKGLKIRAEENPVRVAAINAMGAQATPMAFSEVYGALQQKVVDGAENNPQSYLAGKFYEVAPFLSITDHFVSVNTILIGRNFLNSLPKDLQSLVIQIGKETSAYQRKVFAEAGTKTLNTLKGHGVKINEADKAAFRKTVAGVQREFSAKIPKDWWDTVNKFAS
jgi:tripartite ATP-independent transporter DctP family solute receptor